MRQDIIRFGTDDNGNWLVKLVTVQQGQATFDTGGRGIELQVVTE